MTNIDSEISEYTMYIYIDLYIYSTPTQPITFPTSSFLDGGANPGL